MARLGADESIIIQAHPAVTLRTWIGVMFLTLITAGLGLPFWWLSWQSKRFLVTNRRIISERGVLRKTQLSVPLSKVQDVAVVRGPLIGHIRLSSAGGPLGVESIGPLRPGKLHAFVEAITRGTDLK